MRRLLLLRHAKTENESASGRDRDRQLDERGRGDAAEVGRFIGRHRPLPEAVLVSPATRTHQTWDIVRASLAEQGPAPEAELRPELYGADVLQLLFAIRGAALTDPTGLMIVGHNPGLHELALALCGGGDDAARQALGENLPTSGLAVFEFDSDDWEDVAFRRGRLVRFVSPKLLKLAPDD